MGIEAVGQTGVATGSIAMLGVCGITGVVGIDIDIEAIWVLIGVKGGGCVAGPSAPRRAFSLALCSSGGVGARCPLSLSLSNAFTSGFVSSNSGYSGGLLLVETNGSPSSMLDALLFLLSR